MTGEDIEKELQSCLDEPDNEWDSIFNSGFSRGFMKAANWRINNVWHKPNEEPVSFCSLLLIENSNGEFYLEYKFDPATTKRWAYLKDLIPNMEE